MNEKNEVATKTLDNAIYGKFHIPAADLEKGYGDAAFIIQETTLRITEDLLKDYDNDMLDDVEKERLEEWLAFVIRYICDRIFKRDKKFFQQVSEIISDDDLFPKNGYWNPCDRLKAEILCIMARESFEANKNGEAPPNYTIQEMKKKLLERGYPPPIQYKTLKEAMAACGVPRIQAKGGRPKKLGD